MKNRYERLYRITTNNRLYELCNENRWFTRGDKVQYERFFAANDRSNVDTPKTIYSIAALVWICSSNWEFEDILEILRNEQTEYLEMLALLSAEEQYTRLDEYDECEPLPFE